VPRLRAPQLVTIREGALIVERDPRRSSGRLLTVGGMESSYIDLADPRHLEFDYMRWLRIVLRHAQAKRVLHVGGGAAALARALASEDPTGRQEVCEIDADVIDISRRHLGLRRAPGLHVRQADGRAFIETQADGSWDAIVIDAFIAARVPHHLTTVEAFALTARVAPLVLVNVVDDRAGHEIGTIAAAISATFPHVWAFGERPGNTIVAGQLIAADLDRLSVLAAADPAPPRLIEPDRLAGLIAASTPRRDPQPRSQPSE
jgi:hypothetical protein